MEYGIMREKYEAEQKRRRENPGEYPWFIYKMFGYHQMEYLSDAEAKESIRFYHLIKNRDIWMKAGKQPIYLSRRAK